MVGVALTQEIAAQRAVTSLQQISFDRGERPAGRAELLAKRGYIGQMQISAELVPIPNASGCVRIRPDASGF